MPRQYNCWIRQGEKRLLVMADREKQFEHDEEVILLP